MHDLDALIKTLILLSSRAARQLEICGWGAAGEEMALDFESYFCERRERYLEAGALTPDQLAALDELDRTLRRWSGEANEALWLDTTALYSDPRWERIRALARACLVALGKQHLDLAVQLEIETATAADGTPLLIQRTRLELVSIEPDDPPN